MPPPLPESRWSEPRPTSFDARDRDPVLNTVLAFGLAWGGFVAIKHAAYWSWIASVKSGTYRGLQPNRLAFGLAALEVVAYGVVLAAVIVPARLSRVVAIVGFSLAAAAVLGAAGNRAIEIVARTSDPAIMQFWNVWSLLGPLVVPVVGLVFTVRRPKPFMP